MHRGAQDQDMKQRVDTVTAEQLFAVLEQAGRPLRLDDILRLGAFSRRLKRDILEELHGLAREGRLVRLEGGSWVPAGNLKMRRGILSVQRSGAAFVTPEDAPARAGQDVYIAPEHVGDAWNGDTVEVMLLPVKRGSHKGPEGRVIGVVQRGQTEIVARVLRKGSAEHTAVCRPADSRLSFDVIADISALEAEPEEQELLRIAVGEKLEEGGNRPLWSGRALASLGQENDAEVQERFTKLNNGIPMEFPDNVVAEAEAAAADGDMEGLADLCGEMLVTIDGEDARDFDDAVCVSRTAEGWRLLVAIADVSHYVRPRTALDREARERGNSYYFPLSVEPMLPEALCNGVCSLRPQERRRCMAVDMTLDEQGNLVETHFSNAVMMSRARLTYREVQAALDDPEGEAARTMEERAPGVPAMLEEAAELAGVLMERRHRQGGLDFDLPEAEFVVERVGGSARVTGIHNRERLFSHRLIEAFMVRANEAVAEFLTRHNAPFLYRVHPSPGPDRLEELYHVLRGTDADLPLPRAAKATTPVWLPHVLEAAADTDQAFIVNRLTLRSMMQARYSPEEDGHFGLASACYCHFTSPIRRYADLVNHRALRYVLGLDTGGAIPAGHKLLEVAEQCNGRERAAVDAEREINRRMGCLLLQGRTGEYFGGVISGVMNFGFFVELDGMPVEGMVRVETLGRDYYVFDEDRQELRGEHSGETFRLGQRVTVKLAGVHVGRLEIDLEYKKEDEEGRRPFRRKRDDRASRNAEEKEGGERRTGRRAFAGRKGFRPRRDDEELKRRLRYASDAWGDDDSGEEKKEFRGHGRREAGAWRKERSFHSDERNREDGAFARDHGFKKAFRSGRKRFEQEADAPFSGEERPFRRREPAFEEGEERRFSRRGGEERPFRPARPRFRDENRSGRFGDEERPSREGRPFRPGREDRFRREDAPARENRYEERRGRFAREEHEEGFARRRRPSFEEGEERRFSRRGGEKPFRPSRPRFEEGRKPSRFHDEEDRSFRAHHAPHGPEAHKEHDGFHGAPDDFFAIRTEPERPVHRFGKRRK